MFLFLHTPPWDPEFLYKNLGEFHRDGLGLGNLADPGRFHWQQCGGWLQL